MSIKGKDERENALPHEFRGQPTFNLKSRPRDLFLATMVGTVSMRDNTITRVSSLMKSSNLKKEQIHDRVD